MSGQILRATQRTKFWKRADETPFYPFSTRFVGEEGSGPRCKIEYLHTLKYDAQCKSEEKSSSCSKSTPYLGGVAEKEKKVL